MRSPPSKHSGISGKKPLITQAAVSDQLAKRDESKYSLIQASLFADEANGSAYHFDNILTTLLDESRHES